MTCGAERLRFARHAPCVRQNERKAEFGIGGCTRLGYYHPLWVHEAPRQIWGARCSGRCGLAVLGWLCTRPDEASKAVAEAQLARTINHTLLTPREFARRRRERGTFVARVPTGPTIPILGSLDGA